MIDKYISRFGHLEEQMGTFFYAWGGFVCLFTDGSGEGRPAAKIVAGHTMKNLFSVLMA
jgi:hypothetical protein